LEETKNYLPTRLKELQDIASTEIKKAEEALINEKNPDKILELKNDINTYNELMQPEFNFRLPDFIVNDSLTIKGTKNQVQLKYIGAAHSKGDIIAICEKEQICFMGDLLFEKMDPSWADPNSGVAVPANPENFRTILLEYSEKDIDLYVPGHGNFCTKKQLRENAEFYREYFIKKI
jgi:glyoxylase-like metal-dependent hydrolase (beta-lactamase superfamily II)